MVNPPFKHWYAIVDGGCWYVGYHIDRISAEEQAIKQFNVLLSKAGYCIVDVESLKQIHEWIKTRIEKDSPFKAITT